MRRTTGDDEVSSVAAALPAIDVDDRDIHDPVKSPRGSWMRARSGRHLSSLSLSISSSLSSLDSRRGALRRLLRVRARARSQFAPRTPAAISCARDKENRAQFSLLHAVARRRGVSGSLLFPFLLAAGGGGGVSTGYSSASRSTVRVQRSRAGDCAAKWRAERPEAESPPSRLRT